MIPPGTPTKATPKIYLGVFIVALATLMHEILLTRIFSVTMWYHYAFMAISIALFGITVGGVLVYLLPSVFQPARTREHLASSALLFAATIVASFILHLAIPIGEYASGTGTFFIIFTYLVISVPFVFSGICLSLALTRFHTQVSRLYAVDLAGAGMGCLLVVLALNLAGGPTSVVIAAALACLAAYLFAVEARVPNLRDKAILMGLAFSLLIVAGLAASEAQSPLIRLRSQKVNVERRPIFEKWNSFSRITVAGDPLRPEFPAGWGLSQALNSDQTVRQLHLTIDATAWTVLTSFDGDLQAVEYLKYDITNVAHYLREDAEVLVVGSGGGRDVLAALAFDQSSITAIDVNPDIIDTVNQEFGDFTGHLDSYPEVTFVADEARSYVASYDGEFDMIQISFIDTWAATAAGAFTLTENSLYTVEAWNTFLEHLGHDGILSVSRWYVPLVPGEMARLTSLAAASLKRSGVGDPRDHIAIVSMVPPGAREGVGTLLISPSEFTTQDIETLTRISERLHFDLLLTPDSSAVPAFAILAEGKIPAQNPTHLPFNLVAPTDDSPFFFNMLRLEDVFETWVSGGRPVRMVNQLAVSVLGALLLAVVVLALGSIIVPLLLTRERGARTGNWPMIAYFASIGLGFMLVEVSQMQRLIIFLGHPTYALTVVLFTLLLSSGIGSLSTQGLGNLISPRAAARRLALVILVLTAFGASAPYVLSAFQGSPTAIRILVAILFLFPAGFFMGMAFPLGMKFATAKSPEATPWLWGINGATSVVASVLAVVIAMQWGISAAFWAGVVCYVWAALSYGWANLARRTSLRASLATLQQ